jgi:uncharacterized surface protein with fasciclin (FAS1) repeats
MMSQSKGPCGQSHKMTYIIKIYRYLTPITFFGTNNSTTESSRMKFFTTAITALAFATRHVSAQTIASLVVASEVHQTLEAAVLAAPAAILELLSDETQSLTLFAPDDGAFAALVAIVGQAYLSDLLTAEWSQHLTCVLVSHVVAGAVPASAITGPMTVASLFGTELSLDNANGVISVNGSPVTIPDLPATNGVVHSISGLPILPSCVTQSIFAIGSADPNFSTLVSLVVAAGLADALTNTRSLTLFAPTNTAFNDVPGPVLEYLVSNVTALAEVLLYHVVSGNQFFGGNYMNEGAFTTLQGEALTIGGKNGMTNMLEINNSADFISFDSLASNGVIHVIDSVLIPPLFSLPGTAPSPSPPGGKGAKKGDTGLKGKSSGKKSGKSRGKSGGKSSKKGSTSTTSPQSNDSMPQKTLIRKPTKSK